MDVSRWSMDQILMLPDHCLSRRYSVFCELDVAGGETHWDISELALPDRAIIHELYILGGGAFSKWASCRLALGDQLPTATAMMDGLEPLFAGLGVQGPEPRGFQVATMAVMHLNRLKMYVPAQGRRLVLESVTTTGHVLTVRVAVVVSAVPREVPDCLLSA